MDFSRCHLNACQRVGISQSSFILCVIFCNLQNAIALNEKILTLRVQQQNIDTKCYAIRKCEMYTQMAVARRVEQTEISNDS